MHQYTHHHTIPAIETDIAGLWRLSAAFVAMQEIAGAHAQLLHLGREDLLPHNVVWVLTRIAIEMNAYPAHGDDIVIDTWYTPPQRLQFERYFEFKDAQGCPFGRASTSWVFMDLTTRRAVRPSAAGIVFPQDELLREGLAPPVKVRYEGEAPFHSERTPLYSDIDVNGHLNNTRYVDWICDLFPVERFNRERIAAMTINYAHEARPGDAVAQYLAVDGPSFYASGIGKGEGRTIFEAQGEFAAF